MFVLYRNLKCNFEIWCQNLKSEFLLHKWNYYGFQIIKQNSIFFIFPHFVMHTAIEFSERLSFFGLSTNLITYLTKVIQQELKTAAKNVNYWAGVTTMMPLLGGFLADAYIGRYYMILISSTIYLMVIIYTNFIFFIFQQYFFTSLAFFSLTSAFVNPHQSIVNKHTCITMQ